MPDPPQYAGDENDMSISLLIRFGDFHYFVDGDIELPTKQKIADRNIALDIDVYQANHHGADNGSNQVFWTTCNPPSSSSQTEQIEDSGTLENPCWLG